MIAPRPSKGTAWRRVILVLAVLVTLGTLLAVVTLTRRPPPTVPAPADVRPAGPVPDSDRLYLSGLDYSAYDGSEPMFRLQAKELIHRKRRFGPFTVNPIKEVELRGVRIEIFPPNPSRPDGSVAATDAASLEVILKGTLASKDLGLVSRVLLRDLEIDDRRTGDSILLAREATWQPGEERLALRGPFEIRDGNGIRRGSDGWATLQGTTWKTSVDSP